MDRFLSRFGISKGNLELEFPKSHYYLGTEVLGRLTFRLKNPSEARVLWAEIRATQRITEAKPMRVRSEGKWEREIRKTSTNHTLYKYRVDLDGHHLYDEGEFSFSLPLPEKLEGNHPKGDLGQTAELLQGVMTGIPVSRGPIRWFVEAKLEIPWGIGISDKKEINVLPALDGSKKIRGPLDPNKAEKRFCGECGQKREVEEKFCQYCGQKF